MLTLPSPARLRLILLACAALLCIATLRIAQAAEPAANLAGNWQLTVESAMGKRSPTLVLQQQGTALTGTYTGGFGTAPVTGSVNGTSFKFSFTARAMMQEMHVTYEGKVTGNTMAGAISAAMGEGTFTGVRK
jgi:hypothetical protein